jgi:hypothetical protein
MKATYAKQHRLLMFKGLFYIENLNMSDPTGYIVA